LFKEILERIFSIKSDNIKVYLCDKMALTEKDINNLLNKGYIDTGHSLFMKEINDYYDPDFWSTPIFIKISEN
jgi:hypothetical protein